MIVDCHTHVWQSPTQLGSVDLGELSPGERRIPVRLSPSGKPIYRELPTADPDDHFEQTRAVDKAIVLGFKSTYLKAEVPNQFISDYVKKDADRLIGFAGIDPTDESAVDDVLHAREVLGLRGIAISPGGQDFNPTDTRAMAVYEKAMELKMPIVFHPGGLMSEQSKLEHSRPFLIDEVARSFPNLKIVIAQMGQPWVDETIAMIAKHPNVYADISGLLLRPWPAFNALANASSYGVIDKLLFGSDYPYTRPSDCIESLFSINQLVQGTNLPVVPREELRGIVERDTLELLGLE